MNRDYIIIWRDELGSDKHFDEYCQMKNAEQVNDELEPDANGNGCKFLTIPKLNEIRVPITEDDIEEFKVVVYDNYEINWVFNTQDNVPIEIYFINQEEN